MVNLQDQNSPQQTSLARTIYSITEAVLGWNPQILEFLKEKKWYSACFYLLVFLIDFLDAVFDLILSVRTIVFDTDGKGSFGYFLFAMTVWARIIGAMWVLVIGREADEVYKFSAFLMMESSICIIEDGAVILFLAKQTGERDLISNISMYITIICGLAYTSAFLFRFVPLAKRSCSMYSIYSLFGRRTVYASITSVMQIGCTIFLAYILITQVILSTELI